jgi:hypothetical protein
MRQPTLEEIKEVADNPMKNSRAPHLWDGSNSLALRVQLEQAKSEIERLRAAIHNAAMRLETRGGHNEQMPDEAYRILMDEVTRWDDD